MNNPLVSIIIPTYNRADLIGETLNSVIAQTYTNWECIVVDDGSTDTTDEVLAEYCKKDNRILYHHRPKNRRKGGNAARNYGFELSKGEFIQWFDDDDLMLNDFIKVKLNNLGSSQDLIICSCYKTDSQLQNKNEVAINVTTNLYKDLAMWKLHITTQSVLFRRLFLEKNKLFNENIIRGQETEFFSRLFFNLNNSKYTIINKPLFFYRQHLNTKSTKNKKYIKEYKESRSFFSFENLKKGIQIKDKELIHFFYKDLINLVFRGIENNHIENSRLIAKNLSSVLKQSNKKLVLELSFFLSVFFLIKRGSHLIEKRFKNYKISS